MHDGPIAKQQPPTSASARPPPLDVPTAALSTARAYALFGWHGAPPSSQPGALGNVLYCTLCGAARMLGSPDGHIAAMAQRAAEAAAQAAALRGTTLGAPGPLRLAGAGAPRQVATSPATTIAGGTLCSPGQAGSTQRAGSHSVASPDTDARPASTAWQQPGHRQDVVSASSFTTWMAGFGCGVASNGAAAASPSQGAQGPFGGVGSASSVPLFGVAAMRASTTSKRPASPTEDNTERCCWVDVLRIINKQCLFVFAHRSAKRAHVDKAAAEDKSDVHSAPNIAPSSVVGVFDPISHHRSFCPWVAGPKGACGVLTEANLDITSFLCLVALTDNGHMCGWRATLDVLVPGADVHGTVHGIVEGGADDTEAWSATRALKAILPKLHVHI